MKDEEEEEEVYYLHGFYIVFGFVEPGIISLVESFWIFISLNLLKSFATLIPILRSYGIITYSFVYCDCTWLFYL